MTDIVFTGTATLDGVAHDAVLTLTPTESPPPPPPPSGAEIDRTIGSVVTNFDIRPEAARDGNFNKPNSAATRTGGNNTRRYWGIDYGASSKVFTKSLVHGTNNAGYRDDLAGVQITIEVRTSDVAPNSDGSNGVLRGSVSFAQALNESASREIVHSADAAAYRYIWYVVIAASAGNLNFGQGRHFT